MFRNYYEFKVANEHQESIVAIMESLKIRKFRLLVLDNLDIQVTIKANKNELNNVMTAISKYGIGEAVLV